jgi:hypothetical protein
MKYGKKLKLGDAYVTPRNIQEVQASKLCILCAFLERQLFLLHRHPFFIGKN